MAPKTYRASQQTKNKITQKAIDLFNEHGTAAVSLNSLAEALGISAGNLQYHYRSKEEIIRAILEVMFNDWNRVYQEMGKEAFSLETLRRTMKINFRLVWKYRFFYRELNALLRNDERLAARYACIQEQRLAEQESQIKRMGRRRGARSISRTKLRNMLVTGWILSNSMLSYLESTGRKVEESVMEEAVKILIQHYEPYLQEKIS